MPRPGPDLTSAELAAETEFLLRRDLRASGVSARVEARRVASGLWHRPLRGVVAADPPDRWGLLLAALGRAGPDVAVAAATAAEVILGRTPTGLLELQVPYGRKIGSEDGVVFRQTRNWEPPVLVRGWPVMPPARAAADTAAGDRDEDDRRALVTALIQREHTTAAAVARAAAATPRQVRRQVRRLVEELLAGAESAPEAKLWRGQVEARMPLPVLNHPVRVRRGRRRLDGYLEALRSGYEVQGREHHEDRWLEDNLRAAEILVELGIVSLPLPAGLILTGLDEVLATLEGFWRNRAAELRVPLPRFRPPPAWRP